MDPRLAASDEKSEQRPYDEHNGERGRAASEETREDAYLNVC